MRRSIRRSHRHRKHQGREKNKKPFFPGAREGSQLHAGAHFFHPKLKNGIQGDAFEQDANAVANTVMHPSDGPSKNIQQKRDATSVVNPMLTKTAGKAPAVGKSLSKQLKTTKVSGAPLPKKVKKEMEASFGADFSGVRIHTDQVSAKMNAKLGAQAFTHGKDIYFNAGKFNPDSPAGKHLLAHELTHVLQQSVKIQPVIQGYTVPGELACDELGAWLDFNSPYAPEWAVTDVSYTVKGDFKISTPKKVKGGVRMTVTGHKDIFVTFNHTTDLPSWVPTERKNRDAEIAAWQKMINMLNAHEQQHVRIGKCWRKKLGKIFRALEFSVTGLDESDCMQQIETELGNRQQALYDKAQKAQDKIDPFRGAILKCPPKSVPKP